MTEPTRGPAGPDPELDTELVTRRHPRPGGGRAPTMLLLHGLTDSGAGWVEAVDRWQEQYDVVAVDQRGHGSSPRFTPAQLAAHPGEVMVEDALALLEQLERPVVVGHSLGGAVALAAAVRRPELVRALVLEDPAPRGADMPQRDADRGREFRAGIEPSRTAATDEELLDLRRAQHPDWPESELLVTGWAEQMMQAEYLENGDWLPVTPWEELFAEVAVPTLVVSGDKPGEIRVDEAMERGLDRIANPHVTLVRVAGAGHCIRRERPEEFYDAVETWLDDR